MKISFLILVSIMLGLLTMAQTNKERATEMNRQAVALMDSGYIDQSIQLLNEAKLLDPDNFVYDYEIGFAHYLNNDLEGALKIYKKVIKYDNATDQCYQMLGNLYDMTGAPGKALKSYDKGLIKFPSSGRLFLEKGIIFWSQEKYNEALNQFETGIDVDPAFPSNYYRATQLYFTSEEEVWGMIYGEIFMNIERNTDRTYEISKSIYDTYLSQIQFSSDTSYSVSFSKQYTIQLSPKDLKRNPERALEALKIPFGSIYETVLAKSIVNKKFISIAALNEIREKFIEIYYNEGYHEKYPVALFDYHKQLIDLGLFEAYNYWILSAGNEAEFDVWYIGNTEAWKQFTDWFIENPFIIDNKNKFNSSQF